MSNTQSGRPCRLKTPDLTAMEMLPQKIKEALWYSDYDWSAAWALNTYRKEGEDYVLKAIAAANERENQKSVRKIEKIIGQSQAGQLLRELGL